MMVFGKKKEKELPGLNLIQKLKMSNTVKLMLKLNGTMMELLMHRQIVLIDI